MIYIVFFTLNSLLLRCAVSSKIDCSNYIGFPARQQSSRGEGAGVSDAESAYRAEVS